MTSVGAAKTGSTAETDPQGFPDSSLRSTLVEHFLNHPQYFTITFLRGYFLIVGHSLQVLPSWFSWHCLLCSFWNTLSYNVLFFLCCDQKMYFVFFFFLSCNKENSVQVNTKTWADSGEYELNPTLVLYFPEHTLLNKWLQLMMQCIGSKL